MHTILLYFCQVESFCLLRLDKSCNMRLKSMMSMFRDGLHCHIARSAAATRLGLSLIFFCHVSNDVFNVKPADVQESALRAVVASTRKIGARKLVRVERVF